MRGLADLLRQSAAELAGRMGRASSRRFAWRLSNVHTWASAAHNDADTCLDSLASRHLHRAGDGAHDDVKRRVVALEQATSKRPLPRQPSPTAAAPAPPVSSS